MFLLLLLPLLASSQTASTPAEPFHCRHFLHGYYNPRLNITQNGELSWEIDCPPDINTCVTAHLELEGYPDWYIGGCGSAAYGCREAGEIQPRNITAEEMREWLQPSPFSIPVEQFSVVKATCCTGTRCNAPMDGLECLGWTCNETTTTTAKPQCPDGWVFNPETMFCYFVNMDMLLTWPDAENFCMMTPGGHLTSIADMMEYNYVWNLVFDRNGGTTSFHIGGMAPAPDMTQFTWVDGTPFVYVDWSTVNNQGTAAVCLYLYMDPAGAPGTLPDGYRFTECTFETISVCKAPAM